MSKVDRSYSKYKSIRTYVDRGMMKWNPFATAELNAAVRERRKVCDNEDIFEMEKIEKIMIIDHALKSAIRINITVGNELPLIENVIISDVLNENAIVVKHHNDSYSLLEIKDILQITQVL